MKIFPSILTRTGGNSFDQMQFGVEKILAEELDKINDCHRIIEEKKTFISENLLNFNKEINDSKIQNLVQNVRRDIFNNRLIKLETRQKLSQFLPIEILRHLDYYLDELIIEREKISINAKNSFENSLLLVRAQIQKLSGDEVLRKGLILSSHTLLQELDAYQTKPITLFSKKELNIETSIYKYLTRIATKTTPYSTFNNLSISKLVTTEQVLHCEGPLRRGNDTHSNIRLNNYLFKYLKELILSIPEILNRTRLYKNPTIELEDVHFHYLTSFNNLESFQKLPKDDVNDFIITFIESSDVLVVEDLIKELECQVEDSKEALTEYVYSLISFGFLEVKIPVSGQDPEWDSKFVTYLENAYSGQYAYINELIAILRIVRLKTDAFAKSDVSIRLGLLNEIYTMIRDICIVLHGIAGIEFRDSAFKPDDKFYKETQNQSDEFLLIPRLFFSIKPESVLLEDTSRDITIQLDKQKIENLIHKMELLCSRIPTLDLKSVEKNEIRDYFINKYSTDAAISILKFYEDFYREVQKPKEERNITKKPRDINTTKSPEAAGELPDITESNFETAKKNWLNGVIKNIFSQEPANQDAINIAVSHLDVDFAPELKTRLRMTNSTGAFVQPFFEENIAGERHLKLVLNALFPGYGKMFSRFLHIFDETLLAELKKYNGELSKDILYVENCDGSYFNANFHPSIMEYEIKSPGSNNIVDGDRLIDISNVQVKYVKEENNLCLVDIVSGKRMEVFDLGIQSIAGRSKLYQLLDKFNPISDVNFYLLINAVNDFVLNKSRLSVSLGENEIASLPRISFENDIILQRKKWLIPHSKIHNRKQSLKDADYFVSLNQWRTGLAIPNEVFINVNPMRKSVKLQEAVSAKRLSRDDYKPQYINFLNPVSIRLFEKMIQKEFTVLQIEEMLPAKNHLVDLGGKCFVTEFVIQWYQPDNL